MLHLMLKNFCERKILGGVSSCGNSNSGFTSRQKPVNTEAHTQLVHHAPGELFGFLPLSSGKGDLFPHQKDECLPYSSSTSGCSSYTSHILTCIAREVEEYNMIHTEKSIPRDALPDIS